MPKVKDIMTQVLATCEGDTPISKVARMMRDLNIGDVLIAENGKLEGIVTDRDLTIKAISKDVDPDQTPVRKFMTTHLITGQPDWDVAHAAKMMSKHKIRRLPILKDGRLVGLVSLGDIALHADKESVVAKTLRAISESSYRSPLRSSGWRTVLGLGLLGLAIGTTTARMLMTDKKRLTAIQKQALGQINNVMKNERVNSIASSARNQVTNALNRRRLKSMQKQTRDQMMELFDKRRVQAIQKQARAQMIDILDKAFDYSRKAIQQMPFGR